MNHSLRPQQSLPINPVFLGLLTDPKQSSSTVEPNQPFFFDALVRSHVQKKLVLADPQKGIARLTFYQRFGIKKWVGARRNKLHDESMLSKMTSLIM